MAEPTAAGRSFDAEALPHLDALYRVALRLTGDPSQAEDLVQDTMLKAYRSWRQYRPGPTPRAGCSPSSATPSSTTIGAGSWSRWRWISRPPSRTPSTGTMAESDPEGAFFSQIVDEKVLEAIDALPTDFREVLVLSDMEGLSYAEIAEALKVPVGTVKSRLFRARRQLQGVLYAHAVEMGYIRPREG